MPPLNQSARKLVDLMDRANMAALHDFPEPDLIPLRALNRALVRLLGDAGGVAKESQDRLKLELGRFRSSGVLPDARSARLVCWGTTIADKPHPSLIEDPDRFRPLIDQVDGFRTLPRPYRRCWRGLLDGYLRYDPAGDNKIGSRNWLTLRDYLHDNLAGLDRGGHLPDWLATIDQHANILTAKPCARYGAALLAGEQEVIDPLRRDLSAGDSSWLGREIFDAQIDAAVGLDDRRYRGILPDVLDLIARHDLLADGALARVLDRYAGCSDTVIEPGLRDAAVQRWGNPWLEKNDTRWTLVKTETRKMVSAWLKLRLMEDFFRLLSQDGVNDQRRLIFWKQHIDHISDMYFALGDNAYDDQRPDFRMLRKAMSGRLLRLESAGPPSNNAFIMRIGQHMFVEFGEKGNAMFAFDVNNLPFNLSRSYIAGNRTALKHASNVERVVHNDSGERWERKAQRLIEDLERVRTGTRSSLVPTASSAPSGNNDSRHPPFFPASSNAPAPLSTEPSDSVSFLKSVRIRFTDQRIKGGALWANVPEESPWAIDLRKRGFVWSNRRGAWYLSS